MVQRGPEIPEQEFERRARTTSLVVTVAVHALAFLLFALVQCAPSTAPPEELAEITWGGGGGGAPGVDAPEGPSMRGEPAATAAPSPSQSVKEPPVKAPVSRSTSPEKIAVPRPEETKPSTPTSATGASDRTKPSESSGGSGTAGQDASGTGDKPASGAGGPGVGRGSGGGVGLGINGMGSRGWIVRPSARYPSGTNASATIVLKFTVMPDGSVTGITPIKRGDPALLNAAMAGLRRARARALPEEGPQTPQSATITYTFRVE